MIRAGDIFCTNHGSRFVGDCIIAAEEFWAEDGRAKYSHAGIITSFEGDTFEALSTGVKHCSTDKYEGSHIKIMRPANTLAGTLIPHHLKLYAIERITDRYNGKNYPWWRIVLHLFPPLARFINLGGQDAVCSEIVGLYLSALGCIIEKPFGLTPDDIADIGSTHRSMEVIYEGIFYKQVGQDTNLTNNQEQNYAS